MNTIAIADYGMGNFYSVARALQAADPTANVRICRQPTDIDRASRIVLPGQGAMQDCMRTLKNSGLHDALLRACASKPVLGVCVGEQMLFDRSEEGNTDCLHVLPGTVKRFLGPQYASHDTRDTTTELLKVPHIGWNRVKQRRPHDLWRDIPDEAYFYFVHSYYADPADKALTVGTSEYGVSFTCAVARDNIFAVQFHPEKSAHYGLQLYRNFIDWHP